MSFDEEIATLVQRYLKEAKNQELTIEEILSRPRWKRVWTWWEARHHFNGTEMPVISLDECKKIYGD